MPDRHPSRHQLIHCEHYFSPKATVRKYISERAYHEINTTNNTAKKTNDVNFGLFQSFVTGGKIDLHFQKVVVKIPKTISNSNIPGMTNGFLAKLTGTLYG